MLISRRSYDRTPLVPAKVPRATRCQQNRCQKGKSIIRNECEAHQRLEEGHTRTPVPIFDIAGFDDPPPRSLPWLGSVFGGQGLWGVNLGVGKKLKDAERPYRCRC